MKSVCRAFACVGAGAAMAWGSAAAAAPAPEPVRHRVAVRLRFERDGLDDHRHGAGADDDPAGTGPVLWRDGPPEEHLATITQQVAISALITVLWLLVGYSLAFGMGWRAAADPGPVP